MAEDEGEQAVDEEVADMVGAAAADGELLEAEEEAEATGADLLLLEVSFPKKNLTSYFPFKIFQPKSNPDVFLFTINFRQLRRKLRRRRWRQR